MKRYSKENISWHDTTGRSRETGWPAFFKCVIPWLFFCLCSRCVLTSEEMLHLSWTELDSDQLLSHVAFLSCFPESSCMEVLLRATLYCFPPAAHPLYPTFQLCLFFPPVTDSVPVSAEEITQMEEGTCQLTCSSFITACLWPLYAVGESAATCVSKVETAPRLWGWLRGHLWSSEKWAAAPLLACCQTSCLLACLPATSDPARCGWNANAQEHCHWSALWNVISDEADPC